MQVTESSNHNFKNRSRPLLAGFAKFAALAISLYQIFLSLPLAAVFGLRCRFNPTCSTYAKEAIRVHGLIEGTKRALKRLLRCHPWGGFGADPVTIKENNIKEAFTRGV